MATHSSPPPPPLPPKSTNNTTTSSTTYELSACSISYTKPTSIFNKLYSSSSSTYILRDVSLTARPGELLAIVGPSGAGKSTLLDILAARTSPTSGLLRLNSAPLRPSSFRRLSAHVPQHDASLPLLTVAETFAFAASLLLPTTTAPSAVSSLLSDLRLSHIAHTRLSDGLSGGERRRVSIGLSLLHDPSVLLLDEPTSGLDSASAFSIVHLLKSIASSRQSTIILSVHQPSFRLLSTVDSILLLSRGSVVHHGSLPSLESFLLSAGFTVPAQLNPLEYAMEILHQLPPAHTPNNNNNIEHESRSSSSSSSDPPLMVMEVMSSSYTTTSSRTHEIVTLYKRFWKIIIRSKQLLLTNALEALVVGFLLGTIYIDAGYSKQGMEKRLGFFAFTLSFLLSSTTETLPIFVGERAILLREASSGVYRLSSHLAANTLVFLPYLLALALLYSASVYFLVGLCASWAAFASFVLVLWAVMLTANSFVLFLSSLAPNYISGTSLLTVSLAGFFLFSGYFLSKESMPGYWLFMHYLSPYKYGLDALLANEYGCEYWRCFDATEEECATRGKDVLERKGLREEQRWSGFQVLLGFFVLYRLLYLLVLTRRASTSNK